MTIQYNGLRRSESNLKHIRLLIESYFNTASLDMTKRGLGVEAEEVLRRCLDHARSCLAASDWLVFQGAVSAQALEDLMTLTRTNDASSEPT